MGIFKRSNPEGSPLVKIKVEKSQTLISSVKEAQRSLNEVIRKAQPLIKVSKIKVEKSQTLILSERSPEIFKRSNPEGSTVSKNNGEDKEEKHFGNRVNNQGFTPGSTNEDADDKKKNQPKQNNGEDKEEKHFGNRVNNQGFTPGSTNEDADDKKKNQPKQNNGEDKE